MGRANFLVAVRTQEYQLLRIPIQREVSRELAEDLEQLVGQYFWDFQLRGETARAELVGLEWREGPAWFLRTVH